MTQTEKRGFLKKLQKNQVYLTFCLDSKLAFGMILGPKFKEFNVELHGPKKSAYRKYPKQLDSNGRPEPSMDEMWTWGRGPKKAKMFFVRTRDGFFKRRRFASFFSSR